MLPAGEGRVSNSEQINYVALCFLEVEDALLCYTGIDSHNGLTHYGLYDTVVSVDEYRKFS